jgi:hypothetical protein
MKNVHLICFGISRAEWFSKAFLRHFIEHYLGLGIPGANFRLTLHCAAEDENLTWCRDWLRGYGISPFGEFDGPYDCYRFYEMNFQAMAKLPSDAWIVLVDFDELIFFPRALPEFIQLIEGEGYDLVMGRLIDRLAPEGRLIPILEKTPIWDQFSACHHVTRDILRGDDRKTCLFRNYLTPSLGHHFIREAASAKLFPETLSVYHFKWDQTLLAKLTKRLDEFDENRAKYPWYNELYNLLRSLEGDRLIIPPESAEERRSI